MSLHTVNQLQNSLADIISNAFLQLWYLYCNLQPLNAVKCFCLINLKEEKNSGKNIVYKVHESDFMINLHVHVIMVLWKRMAM